MSSQVKTVNIWLWQSVACTGTSIWKANKESKVCSTWLRNGKRAHMCAKRGTQNQLLIHILDCWRNISWGQHAILCVNFASNEITFSFHFTWCLSFSTSGFLRSPIPKQIQPISDDCGLLTDALWSYWKEYQPIFERVTLKANHKWVNEIKTKDCFSFARAASLIAFALLVHFGKVLRCVSLGNTVYWCFDWKCFFNNDSVLFALYQYYKVNYTSAKFLN